MSECAKFPGRLRDLCEGRGREGRAAPDMRDVVAFRLSKNLDAIPSPDAGIDDTAAVIVPVQRQSFVGTRLSVIFKVRWGALPCSACRAAVMRLDNRTVEDIRNDLDTIAEDIASRAQTSAKKWWQKVLVTVDQSLKTGVTLHVIKNCILEACNESDTELQKNANIPDIM